MVNTESGTTGSTVTEREIRDLPLFNRSVLDLALAQPNVSGNAGSETPVIVSVTTCPGCNISTKGGRPMSSLLMADGTNNTGISLDCGVTVLVDHSDRPVQSIESETVARIGD
jgi:hypothetical protein